MSKKTEARNAMKARIKRRLDDAPIGYSGEGWAAVSEGIRRAYWRRELEQRDAYGKMLKLEKGALDDDAAFTAAQESLQALKKYDDMARASGTTLAEACERYFGMEALLRSNPVAGTLKLLANLGVDPVEFLSAAKERLESEPHAA